MRRGTDITEIGTRDLYAEWLKHHRSHDELVAHAARIIDERGPAMPRRLRRDLAEFIRERSDEDLAHLVARNDDPRDDDPFMTWVREGER
jgi:hypothetical protein